MYFIALSLLAIISGYLWYKTRVGNRYRLDVLALISGGAAAMFLVDSSIAISGEKVSQNFRLNHLS